VSGYEARLDYYSFSSVPDAIIKDYLTGPLNKQLETRKVQLFTEELANWYVARFGGNFADMGRFIRNVMETKQVDQYEFLAQSVGGYQHKFKTACENSNARVILDDLMKLDRFGLLNPYKVDALVDLTKKNIIARHADSYTWNKRIVRIAYEKFVEEERRRAQEELQKAEERRKRPWYRFF